MKIKEGIRLKYSQIFDTLIPEKQWERYFTHLDKEGHPNRREMLQLLIVLGQSVERLEQLTEDLYFQLELLQGANPEKVTEEVKLRTPMDVVMDLKAGKTEETKAYYVNQSDWKTLEKTLDAELAKTKPEYGYSKEIDPRDNTEKTCMICDDLPVFQE